MDIGTFLQPMAKCEHCGYLDAARRWCTRCSSVDPFPSRRRAMLAVLALLLLMGGLVVLKVPQQIAQERLSEIKARTKTFATPPKF